MISMVSTVNLPAILIIFGIRNFKLSCARIIFLMLYMCNSWLNLIWSVPSPHLICLCLCWLSRIKPIGRDEQAEAGVIVAGIEVLQPCVGVETLADEALGLVGTGEAEHLVKSLTKGRVGGGFDQRAIRCGDQFDRAELVLVQVFHLPAHPARVRV